ncbi:MAG: Asp-tRNA(Asn)/Glu-tRNA(Gln) amidotransferase subunit GatA, partial [Chitinophagaceae bacterium]|nr:Asp-tRNA(Asn)/Glu-tRNA(Gln) amidotransferase subunit GatA [Chitinophagaceae bacterium]
FHSISDYHKALQNGQTTCVEAVRFYIDAIAQQAHLNAYIEVFEEEAYTKARELDELRSKEGINTSLHGVIVGLKDVICYKDHAVSAASKILQPFTSIYSATATQKLLDAGAIIIGRQNCDEFAMGSSNENSAYGPVKNARDISRVPGGSSGGSAVAVQAGLCMISLGSDTGGSVRQPADFCGIIGLKPSYGRISRYGLIAYASSFDQIGIFANSIPDAAVVLETIAGQDEYDSTVSTHPVPDYTAALTIPPKTYKIAYFQEALNHPALDPTIKKEITNTIESLKAAGHYVKPVSFSLLNYVVPTYYVLTTAEASSNLSRFDGVRFGHRTKKEGLDLTEMYKASRGEGFGEEVKRRILLGTFVLSEGFFDAYFTKAQQVRQLLKQQTDIIFADYDCIISPTVPAPAFKLGEKISDPIEMFLADIFTVYPNLVGIPAVSIPLYKHENGMPFGLQLMTAAFDEVTLLQLSQSLMAKQNERI